MQREDALGRTLFKCLDREIMVSVLISGLSDPLRGKIREFNSDGIVLVMGENSAVLNREDVVGLIVKDDDLK